MSSTDAINIATFGLASPFISEKKGTGKKKVRAARAEVERLRGAGERARRLRAELDLERARFNPILGRPNPRFERDTLLG